jgi:osmotically inducible protein OsmC
MPVKIRRRATAEWHGPIPGGEGGITTRSGAIDGPFSLESRVGDTPATNPEELLGAAHASCLLMTLAGLLSKNGTPPRSLQAKAMVQLESADDWFAITIIELDVTGDVEGLAEERFAELADTAKNVCPISRALAATEMKLTAHY